MTELGQLIDKTALGCKEGSRTSARSRPWEEILGK
jgi:hypothetical protein